VLTQEEASKEFVVAYASRRLLDAETRYTHVDKLCLSVYHACSKFWHYILSSSCIITCQHDVIKYMTILNGRMGKWAYSLVEYDLSYESIKAVKGQVITDFIVDHNVEVEIDDEYLVDISAWRLYFDGSVCARGCGIGCILVSPNGVTHELSVRLEFSCTNNQVEYEALVSGLEWLIDMGVKHIEAFGDSKLIVQQVRRESQCLDGTVNRYHDRCIQLIRELDTFHIEHVNQSQNEWANRLAQQASGYEVKRGRF
jgi:ribonuclease HI